MTSFSDLSEQLNERLDCQLPKRDWQTQLSHSIGYPASDLPWTQLRLAQFEIGPDIQTAVCCDPVLMQLTHRGAYMLGQSPLQLSQNEAIRIVAQINDRLTNAGESLFLVDKHAWLFTSTKEMPLASKPVQSLIGKDMFNFSYSGEKSVHWQQLATEIQMLIKHMVDYQGLTPPQVETMINVHFSGWINPQSVQPIPFINSPAISMVSDNELIKTFCEHSLLAHKSVADIEQAKTQDLIAVAFDDEQGRYSALLDFWCKRVLSGDTKKAKIICQDAVISLKPVKSLFQRLFAFNRKTTGIKP